MRSTPLNAAARVVANPRLDFEPRRGLRTVNLIEDGSRAYNRIGPAGKKLAKARVGPYL
jgi:hypothetical protein